jgi:quinol monooxygenase YgiN
MPDTQQLIIIAESIAKPGHEDELRKQLLTLIGPSRAEPGCVQYTLHENPAEPGKFLFYEIWKDDAAFEYHTKTQHFIEFGPKVKDIRLPSPPLRKFRVIA